MSDLEFFIGILVVMVFIFGQMGLFDTFLGMSAPAPAAEFAPRAEPENAAYRELVKESSDQDVPLFERAQSGQAKPITEICYKLCGVAQSFDCNTETLEIVVPQGHDGPGDVSWHYDEVKDLTYVTLDGRKVATLKGNVRLCENSLCLAAAKSRS